MWMLNVLGKFSVGDLSEVTGLTEITNSREKVQVRTEKLMLTRWGLTLCASNQQNRFSKHFAISSDMLMCP